MSDQALQIGHRSLAVKLEPHRGESLLGYITRLEEANHYRPGWLARDIGLYRLSTSVPDQAIQVLASLADEPIELLRYMSIDISGKESPFFGHSINAWLLATDSKRVCIDCIAEHAIHQNIWNFLPIRFCQKHHTLLIATCPQCDCDLKWGNAGLCFCPSGHDLRDAIHGSEFYPVRNEIETAAWLTRLLWNNASEAPVPHPVFSSNIWNFETVVQFLLPLGNFDYRCKNGRGRTLRAVISNGFSNAVDMMNDWPAIFDKHRPLDVARRIDISSMDPQLHKILSRDPKLAAEYDGYMESIFHRGLKRFFQLENPSDAVSLAEGRALLDMEQREFLLRAKENGWVARGGHFYNMLFDRAKILEWKSAWNGISWAAALRELGITNSGMKKIIAGGGISEIGGFGGRYIELRSDDIQAAAKLMRVHKAFSNEDRGLSIGQIANATGCFNVHAGVLVTAAMKGEIRVGGGPKTKLFEVELSCSSVIAWLRQHRQIDEQRLRMSSKTLLRRAECDPPKLGRKPGSGGKTRQTIIAAKQVSDNMRIAAE